MEIPPISGPSMYHAAPSDPKSDIIHDLDELMTEAIKYQYGDERPVNPMNQLLDNIGGLIEHLPASEQNKARGMLNALKENILNLEKSVDLRNTVPTEINFLRVFQDRITVVLSINDFLQLLH